MNFQTSERHRRHRRSHGAHRASWSAGAAGALLSAACLTPATPAAENSAAATPAAAPATASETGSWPQFGGPGRDWRAGGPAIATSWPEAGPKELWRRPLGSGNAPIAVSHRQGDGSLYTAHRNGDSDIFSALDATDGRTLWQREFATPYPPDFAMNFGDAPHATPLVTEDLVIVAGSTGRLAALTRDDGTVVWQQQLWDAPLDGYLLERGYAPSPLLHRQTGEPASSRDLVITVVGGSSALAAFDLRDGSLAWTAGEEDAAYISPVLVRRGDGRPLVVTLFREAALGVDPDNGEVLWRQPIDSRSYANCISPVVDPTGAARLYFTSAKGGLLLDVAAQPRRVFQQAQLGSQIANSVWLGDTIFGVRGSSASNLYSAIDAATGELLWRDRRVGAAMTVASGGFEDPLLALDQDGRLWLLQPSREGLDVLASHQLFSGRVWTAPTLVDGVAYLRDRSEIVALDLR